MTTHQLPLRSVAGGRQVHHPRSRRRLRPWILFAVIVVVAFFGLTYSRTSLDRSAITADGLEEEITVEQDRHFELRAEVAEMRDPRRIAAEAADLGMVYPGELARLSVERRDHTETAPEHRWAQLKSLLGAQPGSASP